MRRLVLGNCSIFLNPPYRERIYSIMEAAAPFKTLDPLPGTFELGLILGHIRASCWRIVAICHKLSAICRKLSAICRMLSQSVAICRNLSQSVAICPSIVAKIVQRCEFNERILPTWSSLVVGRWSCAASRQGICPRKSYEYNCRRWSPLVVVGGRRSSLVVVGRRWSLTSRAPG